MHWLHAQLVPQMAQGTLVDGPWGGAEKIWVVERMGGMGRFRTGEVDAGQGRAGQEGR